MQDEADAVKENVKEKGVQVKLLAEEDERNVVLQE